MEIVKENQSIEAHSLILTDIGLDFQDALSQLEKSAKEHKIKLDKIIICSKLGTKNSRIMYKRVEKLKEIEEVLKPYCIIIPGKLHFLEGEMLERFK